MYKKILLLLILGFILSLAFQFIKPSPAPQNSTWWEFQSIDTMKYSRDLAREKLRDASFNIEIEKQIKNIADTGATHVAIATPYDDEFFPILKRWVDTARRYDLKVWFRGNFSGWEEWFEYESINRDEHLAKTQEFISKNSTIFHNGDIFTACPECENGGPGDPRMNGDAQGHKQFLIEEHKMMEEEFRKIGKDVNINYNSMNGDVARLIMDRDTTAALGGIVTIDHYVESPEELIKDIKEIAENSGGKIVLGEFGAPIPDIHGSMSDDEQSTWLEHALSLLVETDEVIGMNYWTNTGSSTALWKEDGTKKQSVDVLTSFYNGEKVYGRIIDKTGHGVKGVNITLSTRRFFPDNNGSFSFPYFGHVSHAKIDAPGHISREIDIAQPGELEITLERQDQDLFFNIRKFIRNISTF